MATRRDNQIHFVAKRNKVNMDTSVEELSWTSRQIESFKSTGNIKYDYAKMFRSIAFECLRMASEYELVSDGIELFPDVVTSIRRTTQIRKMVDEHKDMVEDEEFYAMTSINTVEKILLEHFNIEMNFEECYYECGEICVSFDRNDLSWMKCEVQIIKDDKEVVYTIGIGMYKTELGSGVIDSLIVIDENDKKFLFEKEFEYGNRKLKQ